jgi:cytosine/adenosine deaminase-related metal-dependent hydrolase
LLVHDALVLTVDERNRLYERGTVLVTDGCIEDVRTSRGGNSEIDASTIIDGNGKLVIPGLVNAHTHLEMTPLIGGFSELNLTEMLGSGTALSNKLGNGDFEYLVEAGVELAALNFLLGGVTTVNSMDARPAAGTEAFGEAGLRGFFGPAISDLFWDQPVDQQFSRDREFVETYHDTYDGRIRATICPHDDWACTRQLWGVIGL